MSRWAKSGVLDKAFEQLQRAQVVQIKIEAVSLDSTSVNVHPDGTGARKKPSAGYRQVPLWLEQARLGIAWRERKGHCGA